jgi:hypothetical protein
VALRGAPEPVARYLVHVLPVRRFNALRGFRTAAAVRPTNKQARSSFARRPPWAYLSSSKITRGTLRHFALRLRGGMSSNAASPGLFRPYDTLSGQWLRYDRGSLLDPRRVRGLVTPCTTSTIGPTGARCTDDKSSAPLSPGASLGFSLQGVLPVAIGPSFKGPCPLDVCRASVRSIKAAASGPFGCSDTVVFRALFPQRIRAVASANRRQPSMPSWGFSLQSLLSSAPAPALFAGASPLTFWQANVSSRLGLRVFRYGGVGQPVSGLPSLLGFLAS